MKRSTKKSDVDELTGLPILASVYDRVRDELNTNGEVGFLYFDIVQFRQLEEKYGYEKCGILLKLVGQSLLEQRSKLYRDEDLVVVGGKGLDYFILFLFSPPRKKDCFANHDLKLISTRIKQRLKNVINELSDELELEEEIDFHTGYIVIKKDPHMPVERLIYEARKEAGFKSQLEEIMVQFISNVSHELRTPLTSIKGYTETLLEGAMNDPNLCSRWLQIIYDEAQRLERLINDLLDLSMLEAEQVDLCFKSADIKKLIDESVAILLPLAIKEDIKIITSFDEDLPIVVIDRDRIKQVLLNLIHNAVKYSPKKGGVVIKGRKLSREIEITISDQGVGIPPNHQNRIFERFYRVERSMTEKAAGRGLGLTIAKHIVETHGGNIGARRNEDRGSTFFFTIPTDVEFNEDED